MKLHRTILLRPRYSLRVLFLVSTILSLTIYFCLVRPTALANRFVAAINRSDFEKAKPMLPDFWLFKPKAALDWASVDLVNADVLPWEWSDIYACQRRIVLRVGRHDDPPERHLEWTEDTEIVARPLGLKILWPNGFVIIADS